MEKKFYVYEWYNIETNEVFYVGKGCNKRYKDRVHRNKNFLDYIKNNKTDSRIVKYFDNENEAFEYEKKLTDSYRKQEQCFCNLIDGGYGGYSKVWSKEMRKYWSDNNPMKNEKQKQRMRVENPMKNPEIAKKVGDKHKRPIIIDGVRYDGIIDAAKILNIPANTIGYWCSKGGNIKGQICRYEDEEQKQYVPPKNITNARAIYVDNEIFPSIKSAATHFDFPYTSFAQALKKKGKYKNHKCGYVNQQPS